MSPKLNQCLIITIISMIILSNVISISIVFTSQNSIMDISQVDIEEDKSKLEISPIKIKVPRVIAQDDTNTTAETPTQTSAEETEGTNVTETEEFPPWKPNINFFGNLVYFDENLYYPLALIFSVLGILSTLWLIFFVETSKERTIRERIFGSAIRLILMSLFLGLALHFWILFEPI
ncbi:MAG: hypothetical protein JSW11_12540 [Candidatus Heimdallarchaeota archaeon]|nr:MAG: hypothetical protein JSW11_12540 [Candidatus Heimdallarchaeota archaeon]